MTQPLPEDASAKEIYQDLLDRITASYAEGDFEAYSRMIRVPHEVSSLGPKLHINTMGELRVFFDTVRLHFELSAVTDYVRTCLAAEFISDTEIVGAHETRMLAGTQVVEEPYPVKSHLRFIDGIWWVCKSDNAVQPDDKFGRILKSNASGRGKTSDPNRH